MDKLLKQAHKSKGNWWVAFKDTVNLPGYRYYEHPTELKYRYPAPGSCNHDRVDHPNLFKRHWKTPFKDSHLNVRTDERVWDDKDGFSNYVSAKPEFDANNKYDRIALRGADNNYDDIEVDHDYLDEPLNSDEMLSQIHEICEKQAEGQHLLTRDYSDYHDGVEQEYNQIHAVWWDRDMIGVEGDPRFRHIVVDLEHWVEDVIGAK